jgi:hypothetical protein
MTPQQEAAALRHFFRLMSELGQSLQIDTPLTRPSVMKMRLVALWRKRM